MRITRKMMRITRKMIMMTRNMIKMMWNKMMKIIREGYWYRKGKHERKQIIRSNDGFQDNSLMNKYLVHDRGS